MKMRRCNGGDPENDFLLPFYEWNELTEEQKKEIKSSLGRWMGKSVTDPEYTFGKGVYYGQHLWFAIFEKSDEKSNRSDRPNPSRDT